MKKPVAWARTSGKSCAARESIALARWSESVLPPGARIRAHRPSSPAPERFERRFFLRDGVILFALLHRISAMAWARISALGSN